jgi:hypothetical protein
MDSKITEKLTGAVVGTDISTFNQERIKGMVNPRFTDPDVQIAL